MQITIDVTPDDLANIIVDNSLNKLHSRNLLMSIIDKARKQVEIQTDEIEQIEYLLSEYGTKDDENISEQSVRIKRETKEISY